MATTEPNLHNISIFAFLLHQAVKENLQGTLEHPRYDSQALRIHQFLRVGMNRFDRPTVASKNGAPVFGVKSSPSLIWCRAVKRVGSESGTMLFGRYKATDFDYSATDDIPRLGL